MIFNDMFVFVTLNLLRIIGSKSLLDGGGGGGGELSHLSLSVGFCFDGGILGQTVTASGLRSARRLGTP